MTGTDPVPRRRWAPEPVETSVRSSRRRFAPEPVETTARSSKDRPQRDDGQATSAPRRKFLPQPVETTKNVRRRRPPSPEDDSDSASPSSRSPSPASRSSSGSSRHFTPDLISTEKGSYRKAVISAAERKLALSKTHSSTSSHSEEALDTVHNIHESRFSAANLAKREHVLQRQHSFQVPTLPSIESDSSDEQSEPPSSPDTPSDSSASISRRQSRPSADHGSYVDYMRRLECKSKEQELQEQAMAAYINERPHEPVDHFAIGDDDEDGPIRVGRLSGHNGATARLFRRDSAEDMKWELKNIQRHHEQLEAAKKDLKECTAGQSRFSSAALLARQKHGAGAKPKKRDSTRTRIKKLLHGGKNETAPTEDDEIAKMRNAASPPMAGDDLVFVTTLSPKMTKCETDQAPRPRTADDDESDEHLQMQGEPRLWSANSNVSRRGSAGLWMGMCQRGPGEPSRPPTPMRSGLQTPSHDIRNPFDAPTPSFGGRSTPGKRMGRPWLGGAGAHFLSLTPPREDDSEDAFVSSIDRKLMLERQIDEEFPSTVITQIYNYLSLGYPSLARPFDGELSKISRLSMEEIRKDDETMDAKGYVGAPEGDGAEGGFVESHGGCRRWEALRLYVREWARQSTEFKHDAVGEDWGARARRGSWAH